MCTGKKLPTISKRLQLSSRKGVRKTKIVLADVRVSRVREGPLREGFLQPKARLALEGVPVVIGRGFPLWAAQLIAAGL